MNLQWTAETSAVIGLPRGWLEDYDNVLAWVNRTIERFLGDLSVQGMEPVAPVRVMWLSPVLVTDPFSGERYAMDAVRVTVRHLRRRLIPRQWKGTR